MLYAILCYNDEAAVGAWTQEEDAACMARLTVVQDNEQARRLYASLGFLDYGLEKNALKQDGRYYDEVLMAKNLLGNQQKI